MYYFANYLMLLVLSLLMMLLSHPQRMLATLLIATFWMLYGRFGGFDPNWRSRIAGMECSVAQRGLALVALSVVFLFAVAGDLVLMLIGVSAIAAVAHASLHP